MVEYEILNPSGNITGLVTKDTPREKYSEIANQIMSENPSVEQVGFLKKYSDKIFRLEMSGLEFCGNASRAFACFLVKNNYVKDNKFQISVTGYDGLIDCFVEKKNGNFFSTIDLKFKNALINYLEKKELNGEEIFMINLPGISHIFLDMDKFKFDEKNCKKDAKEIIKKLNLINIPAIGVIWFKKNQIHPVVYVKDIDSLFYENSCGSGSMAFGLYQTFLKKNNGLFKFDVIQKNNEIVEVNVELENKIINSLKLSGITKFSL